MIVCHRAVAQAFRSGQVGVFNEGCNCPHFERSPAAEALRWWVRAGVTDALDDAPRNRFGNRLAEDGDLRGAHNPSEPLQLPSRQALDTGSGAPQKLRRGNSVGPCETSTYALAQAAMDLEALRSIVADFDGCALKRTAPQLVFADGVPAHG